MGWKPDGPVSLICFTRRGAGLCKELSSRLQEDGICSRGYIKGRMGEEWREGLGHGEDLRIVEESLEAWAGEKFKTDAGLIFIGAAGIAVRAVARWIQDKFHDPAVVVMDEEGRFAVPILSGHKGGANALAERIAGYVNAVPVITTATDVQGKFAVDVFARDRGLWISDRGLAKEISAAVLEEKTVGFFSEFPVKGRLPKGCFWAGEQVRDIAQRSDSGLRIRVSLGAGKEMGEIQEEEAQKAVVQKAEVQTREAQEAKIRTREAQKSEVQREKIEENKTLYLVPKIVTVGIGCRKGIEKEKLKQQVISSLKEQGIWLQAVCRVATIDRKKEEAGLTALCREMGWPLLDFSAEELRDLEGEFSSSEFVRETVGVDNVCERAAMLGSGGQNSRLILNKQKLEGVTLAAAAEDWQLVL